MKALDQFKQEFISHLKTVTRENFSQKYEPAIDILKGYRGKGIDKDQMLSAFLKINDELQLDDYQDEVLLEVSCCLEGYTSPGKVIEWW